MAPNSAPSRSQDANYPGRSLGLPPDGRGSLASWRARVAAIVVDWAACMVVAVGMFGNAVLRGDGWQGWTILGTFFVQSSVLSAVAGGSFGQLLCRIGIVRLDRRPLGFPRALARAALVCVALPALVIGADRRGLHDLALGTVVVNRR